MSNTLDFKKYNSSIGFEYEFYTTMKPRGLMSSLKKKFTNKKIEYVDNPKTVDYSGFLREGKFVLTIDKSGGIDMYELITPPLPYIEAKQFVFGMKEWIEDFGKTTKHAGVHININLKNRKLKNKLDVFKFILSFDEDMIWNLFPKRKGNIYCQTIKQFYPKNINIDFIPEYKFNYDFPMSKYFGVNFEKLAKNYLEYRYIGGENYHRKAEEIIYLMDYFILHLYSIIDKPLLTLSDRRVFGKIIEPIKRTRIKIQSYENFKIGFPKIILTVDLKRKENIIKTYWNSINKILFDILIKNKIVGDVNINYNTELGIIEIANNDSLKGIHFNNMGFYNCTIQGVITNCIAMNSVLEKTSAYGSRLNFCDINDGKIFNTVAAECEFNNVYVSNPNTLETYISGQFNEGIIAITNVIKGRLEFNEKNKEDGLIKIIELYEVDKVGKIQ